MFTIGEGGRGMGEVGKEKKLVRTVDLVLGNGYMSVYTNSSKLYNKICVFYCMYLKLKNEYFLKKQPKRRIDIEFRQENEIRDKNERNPGKMLNQF